MFNMCKVHGNVTTLSSRFVIASPHILSLCQCFSHQLVLIYIAQAQVPSMNLKMGFWKMKDH
jgi:hypothetical protein